MAVPFFLLFAGLCTLSAIGVITARNPVHAVLLLILAFFNAAAVMLLAGAEFLAMMLVIVYVGAVAVLFLFVVMMLNIDFATLRAGFLKHAPLAALVGLVLLAEMLMMAFNWPVLNKGAFAPILEGTTNTQEIGSVLYSTHLLVFQAAGLVLLTAMIGAIVLTLRKRTGTKKQSIAAQVARRRAEGVELVKVQTGVGVPD